MSHFSDEQGEQAVRTARAVIESLVRGEQVPAPNMPEIFDRKSGVFVTIKTYPEEQLRGCIGYPEPISPLKDAILDSARSAASRDPRFSPLSAEELPRVVVEVSLLTPPQPIETSRPEELLEKVSVGEDGLIVESDWARGLLLPQVPVEWNWNTEEFLRQTCRKAGLQENAWKDPKIRFSRFHAEIFSEETPEGEIRRKRLSD